MQWIVVLLVALLYVHLFNAMSRLYFASDRRMTLQDLWDRCKESLRAQLPQSS